MEDFFTFIAPPENIKRYTLSELIYLAHKELGFSPENISLSDPATIIYKNRTENYTKKLDHHAINLAHQFDKWIKEGCSFRYADGKLEILK